MNLINKISENIKSYRAARKRRKENEHKRVAENDALARFNISKFNGKAVILYDDVVISVPDDKITGDMLIQSMLELRDIYVKLKM